MALTQPPPTRIRIDSRQLHIRDQRCLAGHTATACPPDRRPASLRAPAPAPAHEQPDPQGRAYRWPRAADAPPHGTGHGGVGLAEGGKHLDPPGSGERATSRTKRLLPIPGEPTTATTAPWASMARSNKPSAAAISHRRPTRVDSTRSVARCRSPMPNSRWAPPAHRHP